MMRRTLQNGHEERKRPPRTPRKLRAPDHSSPEAGRNTPQKANYESDWISSPEQQHKHRVAHSHAQLNGVLQGEGITNGAKAKRVTTNSPRKLPDNRFQSIRKQLDRDRTANGANGTSTYDSQSAAGESEVSKPAVRRQPRKLSVAQTASGIDGVGQWDT